MSFAHLSPATLRQWLESDRPLTVVDIRDPLSFAGGHITHSQHLDNATVGAFIDQAPPETPVVVVCYHGHSSQQAASWLAGQGFSDVYSLDGGFEQWRYEHLDYVDTTS
ncbi:thiosulfate sulfurtransferase GlpE [Larsenimonas salina]|uniref:thiosulfate sulfurtransferase GlpE n=1 Tax=Larsenimonas salina TaxID=1295565 RepID=UPI0020739AD2|nr:thiosulfate sulfurtransferase GlpE [Larsenimonas salina]MCM5703904.1 thiosulfate sulfurtransferase GlpE [Larsenimonas salina]